MVSGLSELHRSLSLLPFLVDPLWVVFELSLSDSLKLSDLSISVPFASELFVMHLSQLHQVIHIAPGLDHISYSLLLLESQFRLVVGQVLSEEQVAFDGVVRIL